MCVYVYACTSHLNPNVQFLFGFEFIILVTIQTIMNKNDAMPFPMLAKKAVGCVFLIPLNSIDD